MASTMNGTRGAHVHEPTLTVCRNGTPIFISNSKWLHPLFELEAYLVEHLIQPENLILQDKIIGKAAALLIHRLGFRTCAGVFGHPMYSYSHATVPHAPVAPLTAMTLSHCCHNEMYSAWSLNIPSLYIFRSLLQGPQTGRWELSSQLGRHRPFARQHPKTV